MADGYRGATFDAAAATMPTAGTLANFYVHTTSVASGWTFQVYKNGLPTPVQCTILTGAQDCTGGALSVSFVAGEKVAVVTIKNAGAVGGSAARWTATY